MFRDMFRLEVSLIVGDNGIVVKREDWLILAQKGGDVGCMISLSAKSRQDSLRMTATTSSYKASKSWRQHRVIVRKSVSAVKHLRRSQFSQMMLTHTTALRKGGV